VLLRAAERFEGLGRCVMDFLEYSTLVDTGLVIALALVVWAAYRELRSRAGRRINPET
jgi:hypothetical protein